MDFRRLDGGAKDKGEDGERNSGLLDIGVIFNSEETDESAVIKVSCEMSETVEGFRGSREARSST